VETYYQMGEYAQADNALKNLSPQFELDKTQSLEYENYARFHEMKNRLQESGRYWDSLTEKEIDELIFIAEFNNERSSTMAKGVLCFFYNICYEDNIPIEGELPLPKKGSLLQQNVVTSSDIKVYPNPTENDLNVSFSEMPEGNVFIQFFDVTGRSVHTEALKDNNSVISLHNLSKGMYFYRITCNGETLAGDKVVKE